MGGRLWTKVCTISDGGNTYNIYADSGVIPSVTAQHIGDLSILPGGVFRWDGAEWINLTSTASFPAGAIIVAKSGGQHTTIAAGLAAASSGDTVLVYPGTYNESVSIPAGVRLVGFPAAQGVIIAGSDATSVRVTMSDPSTLREVTVVSPSSGSNPGVDCSGLGAGELAVLFNVALQGGGGSGPLLRGAGSGLLAAISGLYHNGGTTTGAFVEVTSGTTIGNGWFGNAGSASDFLKASGTATVDLSGAQLQSGVLYTVTDLFDVSTTGEFVCSNVSSSLSAPASTNGLHVSGSNTSIGLTSCDLVSVTNDVLVDEAISGSGSSLRLNACYLRFERLSAPDGYLSSLSLAVVSYIDPGVQNDLAFRIGGELSVGVPARPAESAFGEGDSTVNGLTVFTTNSSGGGFIDESEAAKSRAGSTFNFFQGTAVGHICYIGSFSPTREFYGVKFDILTAMVLGVSGAVVYEYCNGSSWKPINIMATTSSYPHHQRAQVALQNTGSEHVRFDFDTISADWATAEVNGVTAYWVRVRITAGITTVPILQRIKLHTNRAEFNENGFLEFFGQGQPELPLLVHQRLTDDVAGSSPSNATVNFADGISLTLVDNRMKSNPDDYVGWARRVQRRQDTSRKISFRALYVPKNGNTGTVRFRFLYALGSVGDLWDGSTPSTELIAEVAQSGVANKSRAIQFDFAIPDAKAGDVVSFVFGRDGNHANDTFTGNIDVGLMEAVGRAWSV